MVGGANHMERRAAEMFTHTFGGKDALIFHSMQGETNENLQGTGERMDV
jgi:hypothetical protein